MEINIEHINYKKEYNNYLSNLIKKTNEIFEHDRIVKILNKIKSNSSIKTKKLLVDLLFNLKLEIEFSLFEQLSEFFKYATELSKQQTIIDIVNLIYNKTAQ